MRTLIPALIAIALIGLAYLWAGYRRARIVERVEPCSDYEGD